MFIETSGYSFTKELESAFPKVRAELDRLSLESFKEWYEKDLYTNKWLVYGLYAFGKKLGANCRACPETVKAIEQVPDLVTAGFSALMPGTHIKPHKGYTGAVLRCHLGVNVPEPETCVLKVAGVERSWREGRCLIFDDTSEHEAWNRGKKLPLGERLQFSALAAGARLLSKTYDSKK